jgi:signal transduction histidine kinase
LIRVNWLRTIHARVSAMDPLRADAALAALFVVFSVIEAFNVVPEADDGDRAVTVAAAVVAPAALALRRRDPLLASVLFAVPMAGQAVLGGFLLQDSTVPFLALMVLLYSVGRYGERRSFWIGFPLILVASANAIALESNLEQQDNFFWFAFLLSLPALAGRALRSRALLQDELREKAELAELQREGKARQAIEDERERIASELQAVVANGVTAMVVQAGAVPRMLSAGESGQAAQAFAAIEETGRDALAEMRRLLGVLRREGERPELAPQPGLGRLDALVERAREGGLEVSVARDGDARPLTPGIDLTAYRIVQDALEAAAEQGASRAQVLVRYGERELVVGVRDDREGGASHRLPGLLDRAHLYGGFLEAGREDGGFALRARLPIEHDAAPALTGTGS